MMQLNSGESRSVLGKEIYVNFLLMILLLFFKPRRSLDGFAVFQCVTHKNSSFQNYWGFLQVVLARPYQFEAILFVELRFSLQRI